MLRHADVRLDKLTKDRYHGFLSDSILGLTLASPEDERENPEWADEGYESANRWLLEQTRNQAWFDLLFTENVNYGFRRNLLGLKPIALGVDTISMLLVIGVAAGSWTGQFVSTIHSLAPEWWASLAITMVHAVLFKKNIQAKWVQAAAETYARQLLAACDTLGRAKSTQS